MKTKNTILSKKELEILEAMVMHHGKVVTFDQIHDAISGNSTREATRNRVADMTKAGWLIRLKKGLYLVVTDISSLGFADISDLVIAQSLIPDSYISFESALQYHSLFDQMLLRVDSVTTQTTKTFKVSERTFSFLSIKDDLYFGYTQEQVDKININIAEVEKALIDLLYFRKSDYSILFIMDFLKENQERIDFSKLKTYSSRTSLGMTRKIGFLLDQAGIDTSDLLANNRVKKNSFTKLTSNGTQFNAKWRIYYDPQLNH